MTLYCLEQRCIDKREAKSQAKSQEIWGPILDERLLIKVKSQGVVMVDRLLVGVSGACQPQRMLGAVAVISLRKPLSVS